MGSAPDSSLLRWVMLQGTKVVWSNFDQGEEKLDGENVPQYPGWGNRIKKHNLEPKLHD